MAGEICFFLFVRGSDCSVAVTVHKTAGDVFEYWESVASDDSVPSALLFAGETGPPVSEIASLLDKRPNCVLLAASSVWLLPARNAIAGQAIGVIGPSETHAEMPVFVAAHGWGYDLEDTGGNASPSAILGHLEISTSESYEALDQGRFLKMLPMADSGNPFEIARIAPTWAMPVSIRKIPLTTRCANVMRGQAIKVVGDLSKFTIEEAMRWPNFGRKSIADLSASLIGFLNIGPPDISDSSKLMLSLPPPSATETPGADALCSEFEKSVAGLPERYSAVIKGRLAYSGGKRTLEEIAQELSISRERVRQIEEATLARWTARASWVEQLRSKIEKLRISRATPLYLETLASEDPWFDGFDDRLPCLVELVIHFGGEALNVCFVQGRPIICSLDTKGWEALNERALTYFKTRRCIGMNRREVEYVIESFLQAERCPELAQELRKDLAEDLQFGATPGSDTEQLIEVGRTLPNRLRAILEQADEPLHYKELHRRYERMSGNITTVLSIRAALARSGALYYGRGTYGTWRHCLVPLSRREDIVTEIEQIAYEQSARQWHVTELLGLLQERRPDLPDLPDKYLLNLLLADSNRLQSVGRFVWSAGEAGSSSADRIEIANACLTILIGNGAPMSTAAIKKSLVQTRGVGKFFFIYPSEQMARIAPSVWGLIERDFYLNREQRDTVVRIVSEFLEWSRKGIHISEVRSIIAERMELPRDVTAYMLVSLCQSNPLLNVYRGQYLGLKSWGEPHRSTISEALSIGDDFFSQPRTIGEIVSFVSAFVSRPVTTQETSSALKFHGFQFDHVGRFWEPPSHEDSDAPDEIDGDMQDPAIENRPDSDRLVTGGA